MVIARISSLLRKITVVFVINCCCLSAQAKYGGGSGSAEYPYLINNADQMNEIGANQGDWNKHFKLMADIDLSGYTGASFNIIGISWSNAFSGTFDGNGRTISYFTYTSTDKDNIGLFGYVKGATARIENLGLINPDVNATGGKAVGTLVGYLTSGIVTRCWVEGGSVLGDLIVGGLVGWNPSGDISECYSTSSVSGNWKLGGLVGSSSGKIINSYAAGTVSGIFYMGGLVGSMHEGGSIINCYSTCIVQGEGDSVGGLVGATSFRLVHSSYWDIETSCKTVSDGGVAKTTHEMKQANTFFGWGCGQVWKIDEGVDYPRLWWEDKPGEWITNPDPSQLYGGGSGEPNNPYLIYTADQLNIIGLYSCHWGKHFKLMADINLSDLTTGQFNLIGLPFSGVFDGNGHTISNFTFDVNGISYVGVFRWVDDLNAVIKDLGVVDANINVGNGRYAGALIGELEQGTITGSWVEGGFVSGDYCIGGLIGLNKKGAIFKSYSTCSVFAMRCYAGGLVAWNDELICNSYSTSSVECPYSVGGLVGYNYGDINDSYSMSNVSGGQGAGGLVGGSGGSISNSYSAGTLSGNTNIGGLVGSISGDIFNSYSTATVVGGSYVGGLVGRSDGYSSVFNSYSKGKVSGGGNVGGLIGRNAGCVYNCWSIGSIDSNGGSIGGLIGCNFNNISDSYSHCYVNGDFCVGGLVGQHLYDNSISKCYSTGRVKGTSSYVGGLVGRNYEGIIHNSFSIGSTEGEYCLGGLVGENEYGSISNSYSISPVTGKNYVGGLVGENHSANISNSYSTGNVKGNEKIGGLVGNNYWRYNITNCYAVGIVDGNSLVGGFVGSNEDADKGNYTNCFWDIVVNPDVSGIGNTDDPNVTGKTTEQMQTESTFTDAGWDFENIWWILEGICYPRLWWESVPVLHTEPEITLGTTNTIFWEPLPSDFEYYAECAEDENFISIVYYSGWITETSYEFTGLQLGKRYWYSVKARNSAGVESQWSNVESSLQCTLAGAVEIILDPNNLKSEHLKKPYINKINIAQDMIDREIYDGALSKLENDILLKTDGCVETGEPDKSDWIITCEAQSKIYSLIIETIEYVKGLVE